MLKLKRAEGDAFYKVTFCQQSHQFVALLDVAWVDVVDRELSPADFWGGDISTWEHSLRNLWAYRFSDDDVFAEDCDVEVLTDILYCGGGLLCSDSAWQPIAALMADLPMRPAERRDGGSPSDYSLDVAPEPWMKHPAMWEFLRDPTEEPAAARRMRSKTTPIDGGGLDVDALALPGEDAVAALLLRRAELGDDVDEEWRRQFCRKLRGGKWTGEHKGVALDCYGAYVIRGSSAEDFVAAFPCLAMSASWSISVYGDEACLALARAWIHRLHYVVQLWVAAGSPDDHIFADAEIAAYVEPLSLVQLALGANSALAARIAQIRALLQR